MLMLRRAPTSGGQYHWVSEFAPPQYQKSLSYLTGRFTPMSIDGSELSRMDVHAVLASRRCLRRLSYRNSHPGTDYYQRCLIPAETLARNVAYLRRHAHRLQHQHLGRESIADVSKSTACSACLRIYRDRCIFVGCGSSAAGFGRLHSI